MNTEQLIDRLLDGTLTDSELRQLESQMISDDGVSNEVRELLHLEEAMSKSANVHFAASEAYRQDVADRVKEKMRAETGALFTSGRIGSMLWSAGNAMRSRAAIGAGALLLAALIVPLEFGSEHNSEAGIPVPSNAIVENRVSSELAPVGGTMIAEEDPAEFDASDYASGIEQQSTPLSDPASGNDALAAASISPSGEIDEQAAATPDLDNRTDDVPVQQPDAISTESGEGAPEQYHGVTTRNETSSMQHAHEAEAERLHQELREHQVAGDVLSAVQVRKQLGVLYRGIGKHAESERYLNQVLDIARKQGIQDLEASALGELGLLDRDRGQKASARERLEACVAIKRSNGSFDVKRWENELSGLDW